MSRRVKHFYEFGRFRLDLEQRLLWDREQPIALAPKVFETLVLLVERSGSVVGKEEILNALWPDHFVAEANLTQNIFVLRKALGEGQSKDQYIETVPKRGYRFVASVKEIQEEISANSIEGHTGGRDPDSEEEIASRRKGVIILAVLPMVNESHDPNLEYLSDGITESIINSLSQLPQVHVLARSLVFRYKGQKVDALKIGRELTADTVLVSRVLVLGSILIIRAELDEVSTGWQLWGEEYHRPLSELLMLQAEVATNISDKLRLRLTEEERKRLGKHYTKSPEAYQSYLKGRYYWNKCTGEGYAKAIESFEQAIKLDPGYALAYSGLADSYVTYDFYGVLPSWQSSPKAKTAAINALIIDNQLAEAHTSLACVKMMYERDWSNAEREFKKAIELDPNYAHAHSWYSHFLMAMGRIEESLIESQVALKLDPLDGSVNQYLGWHYIHARQFDRAIGQLEKTLANNPDFFLAQVTLGMAYVQKGELAKGIAAFQRAHELDKTPMLLGFLGHAYAVSGEREAAIEVLEELEELSKRVYVPPYSIGLIYTALGETPEAFEYFEKAYAAQNVWLNWVKVVPEVDSLRTDPRFTDLLQRLKLT